VAFGFRRQELQGRYDVVSISEDRWHAYTGERTAAVVNRYLEKANPHSTWLVNAGAGVYQVGVGGWDEIPLDLFGAPLRNRSNAVCASVERLPFRAQTIGSVVCVGEVLSYCDPAMAIREFARVLAPSGSLVLDFASSRSPRYWFRQTYGRAADLITDVYNGTPERTWIYDPEYIDSLLREMQFKIEETVGIHSWSAVMRRFGASPESAVRLQRVLDALELPPRFADLRTIVASRFSSAT
jgi:SAM-dependent methyltransferase